jgi:hypothetical protein
MDRGGAQRSAGEPAEGAEGAERRQDPIVERLRPDPARPPEPAVTMAGFLGDSDRPGFRRLYLTRSLDYFAEFRGEDVVGMSAIAAEEHPFPGEEATRVTLRRDAQVAFTRTRTAAPSDDFDIDVRIGRRMSRIAFRRFRDSRDTGCGQDTCVTGQFWCIPGCPPPREEGPRYTHPWDWPGCEETGRLLVSCDTGCCPIVEPHPSLIESACVGPCPHRPLTG